MIKSMIKDFIEATRNADPKGALEYALLSAFFTTATIMGAQSGKVSAEYVTGVMALGCAVNVIKSLRGEKTGLSPWDAPTSVLTTIAATAPIAVGMDVMTNQGLAGIHVLPPAGLALYSLVSAVVVKNRVCPTSSNKANPENRPS